MSSSGGATRVELAPELLDDLDRLFDHAAAHDPARAAEHMQLLLDGLRLLEHSPEIGRSLGAGLRELVIGKRRDGYLALYRYLPATDMVVVLAARSQRERDYRR